MTIATITVTTSAELLSAMKSATGGETIVLSGDAKFSLNLADCNPASKVVITSADPENPATFETVALTRSSNIVIDSVEFNSAGTTRADYLSDVNFTACKDVALINSVMTGTATAYNDGTAVVGDTAINISDSTGVIIAENVVQNYFRGLLGARSNDVIIEGNEMTKMQGDGMQFTAMNNVLIKDNYLHDFLGSEHALNHDDMIQFWTAGSTTPSKNITITGNILDSGSGASTQGIFMGNEVVRTDPTQTGMYYQNVVIENNFVRNSEFNGITVYYVDGLSIKNNSVLFDTTVTNKGSTANLIYIQVAGDAKNAVVSGNVTDAIAVVSSVVTSNNTKPARGTDGSSVVLDSYYPDETASVVNTDTLGKITGGTTTTPTTTDPVVVDPVVVPTDPVVVAPDDEVEVPVEETPEPTSIEGSASADVLNGSDIDDTIRGYGGNDKLYGKGGNDTIEAGDGDDIVYGDDGNDALYGGVGNDSLYGGSGDDSIWGGDDADMLDGGIGNDTLYGGNGKDQLVGGDGNDTLHGEAGNDQIVAGNGNDVAYGGDDDDTIYGNAGTDTLYGGSGKDVLYGGADADTLHGDAGDDLLYGEDGDDVTYGGDGNDGIRSGNGNDFVFGGAGHEMIFGDAGNDRLFGEAGNDSVNGGDGDDLIFGGAGRDTLTGGAGKDSFYFNSAFDGTTDTITDFNVSDDKIVLDTSIYTALAGKTLTSSMFRSGSVAKDSNDYLFYNNGTLYYDADGSGKGAAVAIATLSNKAALTLSNIQLTTASAVATLSQVPTSAAAAQATTETTTPITTTQTTTESTTLTASTTTAPPSSAAVKSGTTGNDEITGTSGKDVLKGLDGNDTLRGAASDDWIYGGNGSDTLTGGKGNDVFAFDTALDGTIDTITDFTSGDLIGLDTDVFSVFADQAIGAENFRSGSMAQDANDFLLYVDGVLYYDADGNGAQAAQAIASLSNNAALSHASFLLI